METALNIVLIVLIIAVVVLNLFLGGKGKKKRDASIEYVPDGFPYQVQSNFLSPAELSYFRVLRDVVANRAIVCTKVGLGDVFRVKVDDKSKYQAYRNKIDRKHVDFLLCDPETMKPLVGIELDDSSHQRADRQARDEFVDGVFAAAALPIIHTPVKRAFAAADIAAELAPYLSVPVPAVVQSAPAPVQAAVKSPVASAQLVATSGTKTAPCCPKCGAEMKLRVAKTGPKAGEKFWGCSNYPTCRGMAAYTE